MKSWKIFLALGIIVLIVGIAVFVTGCALSGWKFGSDLDMQTYTAKEEYTSLDLSLSAGEMKVEFYEGEKIEVDYPSAYPFRYEVKESGGKISVAPARNRVFFGWMPWFAKPTVTVRIPRDNVINLKLNVSAGSVHVADGEFKNFDFNMSAGAANIGNIKCDRFDCDLSAGSLHVGGITCDNIIIDLSAGSANLTVNGTKSDYYISVDKSAGSCNVSGQQGTVSGKVIDIDLSAGSVNVHFKD